MSRQSRSGVPLHQPAIGREAAGGRNFGGRGSGETRRGGRRQTGSMRAYSRGILAYAFRPIRAQPPEAPHAVNQFIGAAQKSEGEEEKLRNLLFDLVSPIKSNAEPD